MIKYVEGNLLEAPTEALVNTVNEVGVMGKGIALMFSEAFPDNTAAYIRACQAKQVHVGRMFVTENQELVQPRWIINFPLRNTGAAILKSNGSTTAFAIWCASCEKRRFVL